MRIKLACLVLLLALGAPRPAHAEVIAWCMSGYRWVSITLNSDLSHTELSMTDSTVLSKTKPFKMKLDACLGRGAIGSVYEVGGLQGLEVPGATAGELVVKIPHSLKALGVNPVSRTHLVGESDLNGRLTSALPSLEADPRYPKDPAWARGTLPMPPILKAVPSNKGLLLFKPKVHGVSLRDYFAQRGIGDAQKVPQEVKQAMKDIWEFAQAADRQNLFLDLNPLNLMWVDDPVTMKALKMSRPGIAFYEISLLPIRYYSESRYRFEDYVTTCLP